MTIGLEHEIEAKGQAGLVSKQPISKGAILREMSDVLASKPFRTSKQCQNFLRYVVVNTVEGKEDALKERVIGSAVLERSPDYNTADDPVVRIRASDVRKRLAMYYQDEGEHAAIRITIPPGSYKAVIQAWDHVHEGTAATGEHALERMAEAMPEFAAEELSSEPAVPQAFVQFSSRVERMEALRQADGHGRWRWWRLPVGLIAGFLLAGALFAVWKVRRVEYPQFELFWAPMVGQARPPILYVGTNAVLRFSQSYLERYQAAHAEFNGLESVPEFAAGTPLTGKDLDADDKDFVGLGDVAAAVSLSTFFKGRDVRYDLRFGRDIVFGDFRTTPVVLIGAFNNSWTLELNDKMPYRFAIRDGQKRLEGPGHSWATWYGPNGAPREDYALITREMSAKSGEPVLAVAGLDQTGTRAAAEFVSSPGSLDAALRKLPEGWQNKKVQLVLHATILDYVPSSSEVIASSVQ